MSIPEQREILLSKAGGFVAIALLPLPLIIDPGRSLQVKTDNAEIVATEKSNSWSLGPATAGHLTVVWSQTSQKGEQKLENERLRAQIREVKNKNAVSVHRFRSVSIVS